MEIVKKRGKWLVVDDEGHTIKKFVTKQEAEDFVGVEPEEEVPAPEPEKEEDYEVSFWGEDEPATEEDGV